MDLCYVCKESCDKNDIISCAFFTYDKRKIVLANLMNKVYYDYIPINYIKAVIVKKE